MLLEELRGQRGDGGLVAQIRRVADRVPTARLDRPRKLGEPVPRPGGQRHRRPRGGEFACRGLANPEGCASDQYGRPGDRVTRAVNIRHSRGIHEFVDDFCRRVPRTAVAQPADAGQSISSEN